MELLIDTCTFIWATLQPSRLSQRAYDLMASDENALYLSSISAWEIALKYSQNSLALPLAPEQFLMQERSKLRIVSLSLTETACVRLPHLPWIHKDPADRMLICQAQEEGLTILTPDQHIQQYNVPVVC